MERNLDFDTVIDRKHTNSLKYDFAKRKGMPEDVLPLWVADMDFKTSSYIQDALKEEAEHGIFGYSEVQEEYFEAVKGWMKKRHDWEVSSRWLIKTPGIVFALGMAVKAFTKPGDRILIQLPVYYPFRGVIEDNGRVMVSNTLIYGEDNKYHIDFEDFEKKIIEENIKVFFLCNPHNPVGRVWTKEELLRMGDICYKHHVIVVSDEIHADFDFCGKHQVFVNLKKEYEEITVTCTSPSKTFNLAGLQLSNIFIANPQLKKAFRKQMDAVGYNELNIMGLVACKTAYEKGDEWYEAMYQYVQDNIHFTQKYVEENLPGVTMVEHEGTYLVWLDFRDTGIDVEQLEHLIIYEAKLWLDSGAIFGDSGKGFQRINVACPRAILKEALSRIEKTLKIADNREYL
ncbi:MAG: pyridoxal phosphate-dependent aminotransferase [Lachnospiraceae bacterium]|nr:pyridoxal phosphate-dependent aminotransferase [Lachnospiraceae bacterium]